MMEFQWEHGTWTAPDGKVIAFRHTDITDLILDIQVWDRDESINIWIEAQQWSKNTKVILCVLEGEDGHDIEEDFSSFTKRTTLATYPNVTFWADVMRDKDDLQKRAFKSMR